MRPIALAAAALLAATSARVADSADEPGPTNPRELGAVAWLRDFDAAMSASRASGKPAFLLFQEIPGCAGCVSFGDAVLSHPLLVEAIETEFVPVAVRNNVDGREAEILARFDEPAWNYPVARLITADGADLVPRKDQVFDPGAMARRMIDALRAAGRPVPDYLTLLATELDPKDRRTAVFVMHCFWEGEADLGLLPGVIDVDATWIGDREAVSVTWDNAVLPLERLVREADQRQCADRVYVTDDATRDALAPVLGDRVRVAPKADRRASDEDQTRGLNRSHLRFIPMTAAQTARVNGALRRGKDPVQFLSPRQRDLAKRIHAALLDNPKIMDGYEPSRDPAKIVEDGARLGDHLRRRGIAATTS